MNNCARVSEFMSSGERRSYMDSDFPKVVAYPQNDVRQLAKIMTDIKIDCIPVLFSPWKKTLVGFIELNNIRVFLNN